MISFVIDNFAYILAAAGIYVGGCYTPRAWDYTKLAVFKRIADMFTVIK